MVHLAGARTEGESAMRLRIVFIAIVLVVTGLYAAVPWTLYGQAPQASVEMVRGAR